MGRKKTGFDQIEYNREYRKNNYKYINVVLTPEESELITKAAADAGMSKSAFVKAAALKSLE